MPEPSSQTKNRFEDSPSTGEKALRVCHPEEKGSIGQQTRPQPILFVNYHGTIGGGQVHLLTILEELDRKKFTPVVVCCQDGPFADLLRSKGFDPVIIPFGKGKRRYWMISLPAMWRFRQVLKKFGIRLVHVSGLQEAKLAAYPCAWAKVPMVWVVAP